VVHENRYRLEFAGSVTRSLATQFAPGPGSPAQGHAVPGDSGGALFVKQDRVWQLAGILLATSMHYTTGSLFGDLTIAGDLASYREQILVATAIPDLVNRRSERLLRRLRAGLAALLPGAR